MRRHLATVFLSLNIREINLQLSNFEQFVVSVTISGVDEKKIES